MFIRQIFAIARTEVLLYWRQRGMLVFCLSLMVLPALFAAQTRQVNTEMVEPGLAAGVDISPGEIRAQVGEAASTIAWMPAALIMVILAPILAAEALPRDRQEQVKGILDGLPVPTWVYLAGKLMGVWLALFAAVLVAMLLTLFIWWGFLGYFSPAAYLRSWVVGGGAIILLNAGLATLLCAPLPNRKQAYFVGSGFAILTLVLLLLLFVDTASGANPTLWDLLNPARPYLVGRFLPPVPGSLIETAQGASASSSWLTLLAGLFELVVAGLFAWRFTK